MLIVIVFPIGNIAHVLAATHSFLALEIIQKEFVCCSELMLKTTELSKNKKINDSWFCYLISVANKNGLSILVINKILNNGYIPAVQE